MSKEHLYQVGDIIELKVMVRKQMGTEFRSYQVVVPGFENRSPQTFEELELETGVLQERPITVGDKISMLGDRAFNGTVLAIHGKVAWVHYDGGGHTTVDVEALSRR